jgi:tetratricopeptide (TPR) repeat protein
MKELERSYVLARDYLQARTVTLLGATGVGKTRLVRDFLVRIRELSVTGPRVFRGSAREGGPAYEVFARILRSRFGIVEGMDAEVAKAQVRAQLATVLEDRKVGDVAYFLGQLLELSFQDSPLIRAVEGDAQQMRSMRRAVIKSFLETDATRASDPLVLVFDDVQWAHDDSLELLAYLVENLRGPILLVCLARPEVMTRHDEWRRYGNGRHVCLEIGPLGDEDAVNVVRDLLSPCGGASGVEELVDKAVTLAGGTPALLEQIVRIYHDAGVLEVTDDFEDERWVIHPDKLASVKLPLTVQDAVQARITALAPDEREILERAAAMGGVFWLGGLVAIHRQLEAPPNVWEGGEAADVAALRQRLAELVDRDYVLRLPDSTFGGDEEFVFKHNLEREALERLTPPASARRYHRAIAAWLSFRGQGASSEEYLEMLARHRERAGAVALAAASTIRAGEVARSRFAVAKATELFAKGLHLLDQCDHADEDLRLRAVHHYGEVLEFAGRNDAAFRAFSEVLGRAWRLDLRGIGGTAHSRIGRLRRETGHFDDASRHFTAALALFGQAQDEPGIASALDDISKLHWMRGDYPLALEYTLRSLALRRKLGDRASVALSLHNLGLIQRDAGSHKAAADAFDQALRIRREVGDVVGVSITLTGLAAVARDARDDRRALPLYAEAYEVAKETGDRNRIATILANLGAVTGRLGDVAKSLALLKQAEDLADELGDRRALARALRALGKAYFARRELSRARELMLRAVELFDEVDSRVELGIALRLVAEIDAAASGGTAVGSLKRAIDIFEKVGNEVQLARTCRAYADLLRQSPEHATNPAVVAEAAMHAKRADELQAKTRPALPSPLSEAG